jgi:hypothetical protein
MPKTFKRTSLPTIIKYNGVAYEMNAEYSSRYGQGQLFPTCKHIRVHVLSAKAKGKKDLHGNL